MAFYTNLSKEALVSFLTDYVSYQKNGGQKSIEIMFSKWNGIYGDSFEILEDDYIVYNRDGKEVVVNGYPEIVKDVEENSYWEVYGDVPDDDNVGIFTEGSLYHENKVFKED